MLRRYETYVIGSVAALVLLVGVFFLGKLIWHEATKERPHFNTGKIMQRDYNPAHTDLVPMQQYAGEDCHYDSYTKSENCTPEYRTVLVPRFVPAAWSIQIENCDVHHKNGTQWVDKTGAAKCFHKWIDVDETAYNGPTTQMGVMWGVPNA